MNDKVRLIARTDETGLYVDVERLARDGIKPGSRAVIEIGPYTEEDWVADGEACSPAARSSWPISVPAPRTPRSRRADLRRH